MKQLIFTIAAGLILTAAHAQPTLVHQFGNTNDGVKPQCSVISDGTFLYGTAKDGSPSNNGIIYKVKPDGTGYSKLYDFDGATNGGHPYGALLSVGTALYGMTYDGGASYGVLYKIQNDGTGFTKLLDFGTGGTVLCQYPVGALNTDGTFLYGMTQGNNFGVIFKIKPDGTGFAIVHSFDGTHGSKPLGSLISDGTFFYGMTSVGGSGSSDNLGTIFKIKPDGTGFAVLYEFTGTNGSNPMGSLLLDGGMLYGYTHDGGTDSKGVLFKIATDGTGYTKLYDFHGSAGGGNPANGALVSDGTYLYGTASGGGANNLGSIFRIKYDGTAYADLFDFDVTLGAFPLTGLFSDGANMYGTTNAGGINSGGVVFKLGVVNGVSQIGNENEIHLYPNPTGGKFTIESRVQQTSNFKLEIYNVVGQKVFADAKLNLQMPNEIDLTGFPKGVYFAKIDDGTSTLMKKIIVQ